jgi:hypothetical protein
MTLTDITARATAAIRARAAVVALRDLAAALDLPADVLAGDRAQGRLAACRSEACHALEHLTLAAAVMGGRGDKCRDANAEYQMLTRPVSPIASMETNRPERLLMWADGWERFAAEVDP